MRVTTWSVMIRTIAPALPRVGTDFMTPGIVLTEKKTGKINELCHWYRSWRNEDQSRSRVRRRRDVGAVHKRNVEHFCGLVGRDNKAEDQGNRERPRRTSTLDWSRRAGSGRAG